MLAKCQSTSYPKSAHTKSTRAKSSTFYPTRATHTSPNYANYGNKHAKFTTIPKHTSKTRSPSKPHRASGARNANRE